MTQERSDREVYEQIMGKSGSAGDRVVLETEYGEMTFRQVEVERTTRNRVQSELPKDFWEAAEDVDVDDPADATEDDIPDDVDLSNLTLSEEATQAWDDMVVESLEHENLITEEIRPLVEDEMADPVWYALGSQALSKSIQSGAINGFREK